MTVEPEFTDTAGQRGVAVVGLAGRFPGAGGVEAFWANVCGGVESIVPLEEEELAAAGVPPEVFGRSDYVRAAPRFEGAGLFDAEFFGYTAREAEVMDPQHRLFLETCWQALEDAGYDAARFDGSIGVFGGASTTAYLENIFSNLDHGEALRGKNIGLGFELAFLTSRVSHKLDLKGPSFPVQTACSTSLVAVHAACQSLQNFECDMALSGAVAFKVPENTGYLYQDGSFLSPDGHVRPFDAEARGTVFGSGVGVVVLKRLEDALADGDTIHAVVKGSAIGNDGAVKASFTAPSVTGQAEVITEALAVAGVEPEEIDYIETHGTGTLVGDSIEVQALGRVFGGRGRCALGSVKGNVGHLDAAAGMAGLIKTVLAVKHGVLPPTVNHRRVNPEVDLAGGRFRVQTALEEWPRTGRARRAGVSAFGFGGSNAHVVVEQAPPGRVETGDARDVAALVLSARSERALEEATDRLAAHLRERRPELSDAAYTLAVGRRVFPYRRTVVGSDAEEIARALEARDPAVVTTGHTVRESAPVVFLFGGQGSQHPGMAGGLYRGEPVFREAVDECARLLEPLLETDIRDVLCAEAEDRSAAARLEETRWAQPALFVVQYALARLWQSWGITPDAVIGHSLGEWTAACVAGVFSLPDALALVALRGRLMQEQAPGGMLNTMADRSAVEGVLPQGVALAAHNGPRDCVVSGPHDALAVFAELAAERGWPTQRVATSHAFHCALMEPVVGVFTEAVAAVERRAPRVPVVSNVTGTWLTDAEAVDPGYWGRHIRSTVEFDAGVRTAAGAAGSVVLEIGPGQAFTGLARRILAAVDPGAGAQAATALASLPHRRDRRTPVETLHRALALLWQSGAGPDWKGYYRGQHRRRIPLPTHPLHPRHHWLEKAVPRPAAPTEQAPHPLLDELVLRSLGQSVFRTELSVERHWVLSEHRLLGEAIVPGTTYLEMARAAAAVHFGRPVTELRDVTFLVPLLVPDGTARTVHTTVRDLTDGLAEFTVASRDAVDDGWTVHARGTAAVGPFAERTPQQDLAELRRICALETIDTGERLDAHRTMTFGPRWRESLPAVHIGVNVALGRLDLPAAHRTECEQFVLHPALLDHATGFSAFAVLADEHERRRVVTDRDFFLPVGYDSLRILGAIPARGFSLIRPHADHRPGSEIRKVDVVICDDAGRPAVEVRGFTAKRVTDAKATVARLRPHARHHTLRWVPLLAPTGAPDTPAVPESVLLVAEPGGSSVELAEAIRARGIEVTHAELGARWSPVDESGRCIVPPTAEGFGRLLDTLDGRRPAEVVHVAAPVGPGPIDPMALKHRLGHGVHSLFHLIRALSERDAVPGRFSVVAPEVARVTGHERSTAAVHATLFGLAKVIGMEHDGTDVLCVDVSDDTAVEEICAELFGARTPTVTALRGGTRYAAQLTPVRLQDEVRAAPLPEDGVHLVTGGLGGLGLAVARHLAESVPGVRLALVGRSELPPRELWEQVPAEDTGLRRKLVVLRELTELGAKVRWYRGDVTDPVRMAQIVDEIRADLGSISCVLHAAGVAGDGFLFRKDATTFRATLAPKVLGAAVLDLVTAQDPPDCMVLFGSTVSIFGAAGQGDYTAANSYLTALAEERGARGRRTVAIDWSDWLGTGMAHDHGVPPDQGFFRSISIADALDSFTEILAADSEHVIVGEINHPALSAPSDRGPAALLTRPPMLLAASIEKAVRAARTTAVADWGPRATPAVDGPVLAGRPDSAYTPTERALAAVWAKELGISALNVHDTSFALGVDSLAALRIAQSVQKALDIRLSMADLYRYVTIAELAAHLDGAVSPLSAPNDKDGTP